MANALTNCYLLFPNFYIFQKRKENKKKEKKKFNPDLYDENLFFNTCVLSELGQSSLNPDVYRPKKAKFVGVVEFYINIEKLFTKIKRSTKSYNLYFVFRKMAIF